MGNRRLNAWLPRKNYGKLSMATIQIPPEFKELLNSLNAKAVEYLLLP